MLPVLCLNALHIQAEQVCCCWVAGVARVRVLGLVGQGVGAGVGMGGWCVGNVKVGALLLLPLLPLLPLPQGPRGGRGDGEVGGHAGGIDQDPASEGQVKQLLQLPQHNAVKAQEALHLANEGLH